MKNNKSEFSFNFSQEKNAILKKERNISFDEIIFLIENDCLVDVLEHKSEKYNHQKIFVLNINDYIYCVPFVEKVIEKNHTEYFLKTIFPSRILTKKYLGKKHEK